MNRNFLFILMILLAAVLTLPAFAGKPTEFEIPEVGTEINGFVVREISYWDQYATDVVKLEHEKTGSVLYWLANDNIDRSYTMAFHTPINNDTGMPHVFEHATLGGSEKYPGANTFFEMTNKTSNTFLNALTGQYYTYYPMGSTSEEQLLKYVDFYMSGLTKPLAVENEFAMMREAYRYELDDPEGEISLQGVVYSEMLGAITQSRMANKNFTRMMWPNSYITTESGGDPNHIPELTIEALKEFHDTYYQPSNATMYLTGDVELPRFLELLDTEFLSQYDRVEVDTKDVNYTPLEPGYYEQTFSFPVEKGTPTDKASFIFYGMRFEISDYNDMEILDYVCNYMNDESSPLQRLQQERLPEATISMSTTWAPEGKTALLFVGENLNESDKDTFKSICDDALKQLLADGVNEDVLKAMLVKNQFADLMKLDSSSVYLDLAGSMLVYWTIFGDRDAWKMGRDFENQFTELLTVENLNKAAARYWSDLDTVVMAITVPAPGLKEENDAALRAKLDDMKAAMTPEEVDALVAKTQAYNQFVEESNAISMPEELNALTVETLPEEVSYKEASETSVNGVRVITSEVDSPLIRVQIQTDSAAIPFEDLFDYLEYVSLLSKLSTDLYTREELPAKMNTVSNSMAMYNTAAQNKETRELEHHFEMTWFALPETLEDSFALAEDILYYTDFSDYDYIRADAASNYAMMQTYLDTMGLAFAISAGGANYSKLAKYSYYIGTEAQLDYWLKLSTYTDEEMDALIAKFDGFRDIILNKNNAVLMVMGNDENIIRAASLGYDMIADFDDTVLESEDYVAKIADLPLHTAIVTGGNVAYNLVFADFTKFGIDLNDGGLRVIIRLLDDKLLYPELRVKNSAYGGYAGRTSDFVFVMYSYRDPKVAETYQVYKNAGDFLSTADISQAELDGYITKVYGDLTSPMGPLTAAMVGMNDKLVGENTYERSMRMIRDIKAFKMEDIANYVEFVTYLGSDAAARSTAGARSMIEANAELFDYINYNMLSEEAMSADGTAAGLEQLSAEDLAAMTKDVTTEQGEADSDKFLYIVADYAVDGSVDSVNMEGEDAAGSKAAWEQFLGILLSGSAQSSTADADAETPADGEEEKAMKEFLDMLISGIRDGDEIAVEEAEESLDEMMYELLFLLEGAFAEYAGN